MMAAGMGPIDNGQPMGRGQIGQPPPSTVEEALRELKTIKKKEKQRKLKADKAKRKSKRKLPVTDPAKVQEPAKMDEGLKD